MSDKPSPAAIVTASEVVPGQLSLRAYFVAHAPEVPASFEPVMPEVKWPTKFQHGSDMASVVKRALDEEWSREHALLVTKTWGIDDQELLMNYLEQHYAAFRQQEENEKNEPLERALQWPLYWADTMIERLNK